MLNHIVIMGRLTRDPELRYTQSQLPVATFRVAVDRDFGRGEEKQTDFIDCVAWRSTGEFVSKYFQKGSMAIVSGRLQMRDWTDKEGNKRRSAEVVADNVYFGDSKRDNADGGSFNQSQGYAQSFNQVPQQQPAYQAPQNVSAAPSDFSMLSDDDPDLPF